MAGIFCLTASPLTPLRKRGGQGISNIEQGILKNEVNRWITHGGGAIDGGELHTKNWTLIDCAR